MNLDIRVQPRPSRNAIKVANERITVRVAAASEGSKANVAVAALLAKRLRTPKRSVQLVRGHKVRDKRIRKRIRIEGISPKAALGRLRAERS